MLIIDESKFNLQQNLPIQSVYAQKSKTSAGIILYQTETADSKPGDAVHTAISYLAIDLSPNLLGGEPREEGINPNLRFQISMFNFTTETAMQTNKILAISLCTDINYNLMVQTDFILVHYRNAPTETGAASSLQQTVSL